MDKIKIKIDDRNTRRHGQQNEDAIKNSLEQCGAGRSIVIDSDNVIIAGNGVYSQAQELGLPVKIIETDGRELIALKRVDLKNADEKRKLLALADNRAGELSQWDKAALDTIKAEISADLLAGIAMVPTDTDAIIDGIAEDIKNTDEYLESAAADEARAEKLKTRIDTIKNTPGMLNKSKLIVISGESNDALIIVDDNLADFIAEIKKYCRDNGGSPLERILNNVHKL